MTKTIDKAALSKAYVEAAVKSIELLKAYLAVEKQVYEEALAKLEPLYEPYYVAMHEAFDAAAAAAPHLTDEEQASLSRQVAKEGGIPEAQIESWIAARTAQVEEQNKALIKAFPEGALN